ncbi:MAG: hypothetical protein GDA50_07310 [Alphaproteobacteria bacterium GM202ARS2]|nr:hypothetical protein [Alphaproteobacteria bacterium GM202ARS2]
MLPALFFIVEHAPLFSFDDADLKASGNTARNSFWRRKYAKNDFQLMEKMQLVYVC